MSLSYMGAPHPGGRGIYFSSVFIKFNLFQPKYNVTLFVVNVTRGW